MMAPPHQPQDDTSGPPMFEPQPKAPRVRQQRRWRQKVRRGTANRVKAPR